MRSGYDVCILSNGKWDIYISFETNEKHEAMSLAQQISNNYAAVSILWHDQMRVIYFTSRDKGTLQPTYLQIKVSTASKAKKIVNRNFQTTSRLKKRIDKKQSVFSSAAHKNATFTAITVTILGVAISVILPFFVMDISNLTKTVFSLSGIVVSAISALVFYIILLKDNPQMKNSHNIKPPATPQPTDESIDMDLLEEVTKKIEESQPEENNDTPLVSDLAQDPTTIEPENVEAEEKQLNKDIDDEKDLEIALNGQIEVLRSLRDLDSGAELTKDESLAFTLYCIGVIRAISENNKISTTTSNNIIPLALTRINISPADTSDVIEHLEEYSRYSRYKSMIDTGYQDTLFKNDESKDKYVVGLENALAMWVNDSDRMQTEEGECRFMSVLFTDIVDFSGQTHNKGEKWMTTALKAHNEIVRKVIAEHGGEEVKHTGDGILASFSMVKNSVESAKSILSSIQYFSKSLPEFSFEIRIGVASGEVIIFENDIFGDAVNLAARLVDNADKGTAYVCENTRNISSNPSIVFESKGIMDLKGIGDAKVFKIGRLANTADKVGS